MKCKCGGRIMPRLSDDGSCYERDVCLSCGAQWWNDPPKRPDEMPAVFVCANSDCGWTGLFDETVYLRGPGQRPLCPECGEVVE